MHVAQMIRNQKGDFSLNHMKMSEQRLYFQGKHSCMYYLVTQLH